MLCAALTRTPRVEQELARLLHKQGAAGCRTHGEQQSFLFSLPAQTATDYIAQLLHNVGGQLVLRGTHSPRGDNLKGGTSCPMTLVLHCLSRELLHHLQA